MDPSTIRRRRASLSGRAAAVVLAAGMLLAASVGAAGAALAINNQASKPVNVKAFSGDSCTPQVASGVSPSATLTMACPIREVCATFVTISLGGGSTIMPIDLWDAYVDPVRTCRLSINGSNIVGTHGQNASDGTACDFRWSSIPGDASSSLLLTCTDVIN